jgi:hypothetical protein
MQPTTPATTADATPPAWATALVVVVCVVATYGSIVGHGWLNWDDPVHVIANPMLTDADIRAPLRPWLAAYRGLYIPLSYDLFWLEKVVADRRGERPDPRLFHVVSLLLHAGAGVVVARIATRLVAGGWPALAAAGVFVLHPLQVESVAWISEQRGLLATFFALVMIEQSLVHPASRWRSLAWLLAAVLAKPSAIAVVPMLVAIETLFRTTTLRHAIQRSLPAALIAAVAGAGTAILQSGETTAPWTPPWLRTVVAGDALAFYTAKLLAPVGLCIDYGRTPAAVCGSVSSWWAAATAVVSLAAVLALPRLAAARGPVMLFVLGLSPVLGLVPFTFQGFSTVADRYAALALLGPALAVAALTARLPSRGQVAATGLILIVLGFASRAQTRTWRSEEAVYGRAIAINPESVHARVNLAVSRIERGRPAEAVGLLEEATRLRPDDRKAHYNLGLAWHGLGRRATAEQCYRAAIALDPTYAMALNNLGIVLAETTRPAEAAEAFRAAIRASPDFKAAIENLRQVERPQGGSPR